MDAGHPIAVLAGVIIGALIVWLRRRPFELDVTVRQRNDRPGDDTDAR